MLGSGGLPSTRRRRKQKRLSLCQTTYQKRPAGSTFVPGLALPAADLHALTWRVTGAVMVTTGFGERSSPRTKRSAHISYHTVDVVAAAALPLSVLRQLCGRGVGRI